MSASTTYRPIEINLIQQQKRSGGSMAVPFIILLAILLGVSAFGTTLYLQAKRDIAQSKDDIAAAQTQIQTIQNKLAAQANPSELGSLAKLPDMIKGDLPAPTVVLDRVAAALPQEANLLSIYIEPEKSTLQITANFATNDNIIAFSQNLQKNGEFTLQKIEDVQKQQDGNAKEKVKETLDMSKLLTRQVKLEFQIMPVQAEQKKGSE
ncbi:hypothetical protein [Gorillibacterium massiliense]|uniref:hypothetical protein n=1 Tax=Gorillibacterium massiliense TaxID=1280390 RepID=UPI0004BA2069|nr:hypothetical protein [Gorillibacterium massiliense]